MTHPAESESTYAQAMRRDGGACAYCKKDVLASFDAFAGSCLDHLKPKAANGPDDDPFNRVIACAVCNALKGSWDPIPTGIANSQTFEACVAAARERIEGKRQGRIENSLYRDYQHWLIRLGRAGG